MHGMVHARFVLGSALAVMFCFDSQMCSSMSNEFFKVSIKSVIVSSFMSSISAVISFNILLYFFRRARITYIFFGSQMSVAISFKSRLFSTIRPMASVLPVNRL